MGSTDTTQKGRHIDPADHAAEYVAFVAGSIKQDGDWIEFEDSQGVRLSLFLLPSVERELVAILAEREIIG